MKLNQSVVLALALSVLATPSLGGVVPESNPAAAQSVLDALLASYREEGLPLPPPDAPLVRLQSGTTYAEGGPEPIYTLGFLIGSTLSGEQVLLVGTEPRHLPKGSVFETMPPAASSAANVERFSGSPFETQSSLALAIQCQARGWNDLAAALLEIALPPGADVRSDADYGNIFAPPWGGTPLQALWALARAHWANALTQPCNKTVVYQHLTVLFAPDRFPQTADGPDPRPLLRSLEASLAPSTHAPGTVQRAIDDLVDAVSYEDERYTSVLALGFGAVPELISHLDDERLTRIVKPGFNNFSPYHLRISHVVSDLLQQIAGEDLGSDWLERQQGYPLESTVVERWWIAARAQGEEAYLRAHVLPQDPTAQWPNAGPLAIIAKRHPQYLPALYREAITRPNMQSYTIAKAITGSALPNDIKRQVFLEAAASPTLEHRRAALWELRPLEPESFVRILVDTLDALPNTPEGPYWNSREAAFANVVMETEDPRAWDALLRTARRADVGLRMQLMAPMNYDYIGEKQRAQRIRFLSAMLRDPSVRAIPEDRGKFEGPCAAMTLPVITVRDFAAMQLASVLGLLPPDGYPDELWTAAQWTALRVRVAAAL